jgi:hypothetical protein
VHSSKLPYLFLSFLNLLPDLPLWLNLSMGDYHFG